MALNSSSVVAARTICQGILGSEKPLFSFFTSGDSIRCPGYLDSATG
jgi:hypothetical protein